MQMSFGTLELVQRMKRDSVFVRIAGVIYRSKKKFLNFSYGVMLSIPL